MQQFDTFVRQHFGILFLVVVPALMFARLAWRYYRQQKRGLVFPPLKSVRPIFHEGMASGRSLKNWRTKLGGASYCLRVTVTDSEVWIRPVFPLSLLAEDFDLMHRIPRRSISAVELSASGFRRLVLLDCRIADGSTRRLQLYLHDPNAFLAALNGPPPLP